MKFLSVRSDICRQLPSDSTSRWTPLPLTMQFPLLGLARDFHPLDNAHAERTTKLVALPYKDVQRVSLCKSAKPNNSEDSQFNLNITLEKSLNSIIYEMIGRTQQTQMFNVTVYIPLPWQHLQFIGRD